MSVLIDLTGQTFGRLTVIERAEKKSIRGQAARWRCVCSCGKETVVVSPSLRNGVTRSCGCFRRETSSLSDGEAAFNKVFNHYKQNAVIKKHSFALSREELRQLVTASCHYCGQPPSRVQKGNGHGDFIYNGIDRVDNNKGYTEDNVVPCCWECNSAKYMMSEAEFKEWVGRVYHHIFLIQTKADLNDRKELNEKPISNTPD